MPGPSTYKIEECQSHSSLHANAPAFSLSPLHPPARPPSARPGPGQYKYGITAKYLSTADVPLQLLRALHSCALISHGSRRLGFTLHRYSEVLLDDGGNGS